MSITAKYRITLGTEKLVVSERTVVLINVTEAPAPPEPPGAAGERHRTRETAGERQHCGYEPDGT